ncbi:MAG: glycosyl transferase family 2 [Frankiales bacterium]|nr:glycosyl transferase family 2 [Frankiales bacterium]
MTTLDRPAGLPTFVVPREQASRAPLVSVVMPVRNEASSVVAAVTSVLEQTVSDIEVLVVDGSSTDDTADKVRTLAAQHPRVRLLDNPDRTIPHALNVGRTAARGRYVARVDAHARVNSTYLERAVAELEQAPDVAAVGGVRIGVAATPTGRAVAAALSSPFGVGGSINHYATEKQDTDHASFGVYRHQVLERVDGWDEQLLVNEDVDIDHRILGSGHRIRFDPDMQIFWQVRETLRDFGRQYRRYGRGKAGMVRKNGPSAVKGRHLVAPALVASLGGAAALAAAGHPAALLAVCAPYATSVAGISAVISRKQRPPGEEVPATVLAGSFVVMHLSWGLGFLEGLLAGRKPAASSAR